LSGKMNITFKYDVRGLTGNCPMSIWHSGNRFAGDAGGIF
jgi:hypothetical protein